MMSTGMMNTNKKMAKRYRKEKLKIKFENVLGCDSAKKEIIEIVQFLENPGKFTRVGARQPKGALLSGPPGTGKTMLAKAAAAEVNVPFYYVSGSEFVDKYVGVGAANVRGLFAEARQTSPSIIFIDEIDAIGMKRTSKGSGNEKESTLNQLLVEMDGFKGDEKVIVIGATNQPESLDPALKRPGRFDRLITVELPDFQGRVDILKMYLKKIRLQGAEEINREDKEQNPMKIRDIKNLNDFLNFQIEMLKKEIRESKQNEKFNNLSKLKLDLSVTRSIKRFHQNFVAMSKLLIKEDIQKLKTKLYDIFNLYGFKFDILESKAIQKSIQEETAETLNPLVETATFKNTESEISSQAKRLSILSPGFSGADLKNLCNEAAIHAARHKQEYVISADFEEASERILGGMKKTSPLEEEVRRTVAIHESGHAVAAWFLKHTDPLVKVSIIPRSKGMLGFAQYLTNEVPFNKKQEIKDRLKFLVGGRVAEIMFLGQASTGAHDDLKKAFDIASKYVGEFGMSNR
jgi:ATP-dependent Zn protease